MNANEAEVVSVRAPAGDAGGGANDGDVSNRIGKDGAAPIQQGNHHGRRHEERSCCHG